MTQPDDLYVENGYKIANYMCFGPDPQGFDCIKPINVIVGRNNAGKSGLLDLIKIVTRARNERPFTNGPNGTPGHRPTVLITSRLKQSAVEANFSKDVLETYGDGRAIAVRFVDRRITVARDANIDKLVAIDPLSPEDRKFLVEPQFEGFRERLCLAVQNNLGVRQFFHLQAERDVRPEPRRERPYYDGADPIRPDGDSCTTLIRAVSRFRRFDHKLVNVEMRDALNEILGEDAHCTRIDFVQESDDGDYELILHEPHKDRVPLSKSGSGIKTIVLVLAYLILIPAIRAQPKDCVFAFDELESCLHPALLRRLLRYIVNRRMKDGFTLFLTTHSPTTINIFARDEDAQIVHVAHNGQSSSVKTVITPSDNRNILDHLEVRASDLLQANCVVWVEGPSDAVLACSPKSVPGGKRVS